MEQLLSFGLLAILLGSLGGAHHYLMAITEPSRLPFISIEHSVRDSMNYGYYFCLFSMVALASGLVFVWSTWMLSLKRVASLIVEGLCFGVAGFCFLNAQAFENFSRAVHRSGLPLDQGFANTMEAIFVGAFLMLAVLLPYKSWLRMFKTFTAFGPNRRVAVEGKTTLGIPHKYAHQAFEELFQDHYPRKVERLGEQKADRWLRREVVRTAVSLLWRAGETFVTRKIGEIFKRPIAK